jgi:hypothetical protein
MTDLEIMPLDEAKKIIRKETEASPITHYPKGGGKGILWRFADYIRTEMGYPTEQEFYPYCILPFERRTGNLHAYTSALAHMYRKLFEDKGIEVTTAVYPEAKAFLFAAGFEDLTGLNGVVTRKRNYNVGKQIVIKISPPYRKASNLYCVGLNDSDMYPITVDDTISGSLTMGGHTIALEGQSKEKLGHELTVPGGISVYERGEGLDILRERFPDKTFAGFARLEIVPRSEWLLLVLGHEFGFPDEDDLPGMFIQKLYREHPYLSREEIDAEINKFFIPGVQNFFDEIP